MTLFIPDNAAALDLQLDRTVSQALSQVAKVKNSLESTVKNAGKGNSNASKKQSANSQPNSNTVAPEPAATLEPEPTLTPQTPPVPEALPPEVEAVSSMSGILSRQQLLNIVAKPLLNPASLTNSHFIDYPDVNSFAMVRPSPEGWKILGISWIWWITGMGAGWLGNRLLKRYS